MLQEMFFYGLFMDRELLEAKGIRPTDIRPASVAGLELRTGKRAALVRAPGGVVHGLLMKLSHADIEALYADPGVGGYRPEAVLAVPRGGVPVAALCYNLPEPPSPEERNPEYAAALRALAERVGLPPEYLESIR